MLDIDTELDIILNHINDLYWNCDGEHWTVLRDRVDVILSQIPEDLHTTLLIGFLSTTIPHKEIFRYRERIIDLIKKNEPERHKKLLIGLLV